MATTKAELVGEDLSVDFAPWGRIHVRNKRPQGVKTFASDRIVIFQHGATYGGGGFELALGGLSWMDYVAARGFDAYCLDLPGYGRSTRPAIMDEPADRNEPFMRTPDAAACLGAVIDFVCQRRGVDKVCLIGQSWGTAIASYYTQSNNHRVARLALQAPVWDRTQSGPSPIHVEGKVGAYRVVGRESAFARRLANLPDAVKADIIPPGWFDQWWDATVATDRDWDGKTVRAPNGVVMDGIEYWNAGRPLYDPGRIAVPVLIVVGALDNDTPPVMAQTIFSLLKSAPWSRLSILSGGSHSMFMERNRILLFRTVQQFLEESPPGPDAVV